MSTWLKNKEKEFNLALKQRDVKKMRALFNHVPTVDLAEFADQVEDPSTLTFIFKVVPSELTADFFTELNDATQEKLLMTFSDAELVELINKSYTDDIVDVLEDMPANLVTRAIKFVPKERREAVNKLLNYREDTAASIMTTEYFEFNANVTVEEAMKVIREKGKTKETIYTVFIRDDKRTLVGTVDLDDLIFANPKQTLDEVKNKEFLFTRADTDQEEVAAKFKKYDLHALAVVNKEQKLVGVITFDDIMDVMEQETSEDIALQSGVVPLKDEYMETKPLKMALKCAPWLIALIVIGIFSEIVLSRFQQKLAVVPALIFFIPVLMDTGGNAGGQTCGLIIRGLALREFELKDFPKVVWKEIKTAILTGLIVSVFAFSVFMIEFSIPGLIESNPPLDITQKLLIATIVSLALLSAVILSKFVACALPFLAVKFKKDPALTSQPFVTTIVDVCSLLIYFGIFLAFAVTGFFG
ncbi:MAG: magnesium transporter [Bacilli bacterium]|nr:magnesium transporter [Bacilli bacterium]